MNHDDHHTNDDDDDYDENDDEKRWTLHPRSTMIKLDKSLKMQQTLSFKKFILMAMCNIKHPQVPPRRQGKVSRLYSAADAGKCHHHYHHNHHHQHHHHPPSHHHHHHPNHPDHQVIISQGSTIQHQLAGLKEKEEAIGTFEDRMHQVVMIMMMMMLMIIIHLQVQIYNFVLGSSC